MCAGAPEGIGSGSAHSPAGKGGPPMLRFPLPPTGDKVHMDLTGIVLRDNFFFFFFSKKPQFQAAKWSQ